MIVNVGRQGGEEVLTVVEERVSVRVVVCVCVAFGHVPSDKFLGDVVDLFVLPSE